jgi:hypothetical protein
LVERGNTMAKTEVIISTSEYRPCWIKGRKALFHRWEEKRWVLEPSIMAGGHAGGQMSITLAIIEYEDGTVHEAYPYEIVFCDNKIDQYCFEKRQERGQE